MLFWMFKSVRSALAVFSVVPFALIGGILGLLARGLPFSLPAAVGFIALGGVVRAQRRRHHERRRSSAWPTARTPTRAVADGATHTVRAVLTTAAVAAFGFLPMAISTGAGAEVQRPLATVVIVGIVFGTVLTLAVFPGILATALKGWDLTEPTLDDELPESVAERRRVAGRSASRLTSRRAASGARRRSGCTRRDRRRRTRGGSRPASAACCSRAG